MYSSIIKDNLIEKLSLGTYADPAVLMQAAVNSAFAKIVGSACARLVDLVLFLSGIYFNGGNSEILKIRSNTICLEKISQIYDVKCS